MLQLLSINLVRLNLSICTVAVKVEDVDLCPFWRDEASKAISKSQLILAILIEP